MSLDMACPVCGIKPVDGLISHKHDCPFHQRCVRTEMEKEKRKHNRRSAIKRWKARVWKVAMNVIVVAIFATLFVLAINAMEGR